VRPMLLVALTLVTACAPEVEVGGGVRAFAPFEDGQAVDVVCGPQGGQHIWTGVRAKGVGPEGVSMVISMTDAETAETVCHVELKDLLLVEDDGWFSFTGLACFVPDPAKVEGRTLRLEGSLVDADGSGGKSVRQVVPRGPGRDCRLR
jgi:hypothetical protein